MESYELHQMDEEFKKGLQNIRPLVLGLTTPQEGLLCRQWLEKLRQSVDERAIRNRMLQRLLRNMRMHRLGSPFDRPPPSGPLYLSYEESSEYSTWTDDELASDVTQPGDIQPQKMDNLPPEKNYQGNPRLEKRITSLANALADLRIKYDHVTKENHSLKESKISLEAEAERAKEDLLARDSEIAKLSDDMESYKKKIAHKNEGILMEVKELTKRVGQAAEKSDYIETLLKSFKTTIHSDLVLKIKTIESEIQANINWMTKQMNLEKTKYEEQISNLKQTINDRNNEICLMKDQLNSEKTKMKGKLQSLKRTLDKTCKENHKQYTLKTGFFEKKLKKLESINDKIVQEYEKRIVDLCKEHKKMTDILMKSMKYRETDKLVVEVEEKIKNMEETYRRLYSEIQYKAIEHRSRLNSTSLYTLS